MDFVDVILYLSWFLAKLISHATQKEVFFGKLVSELKSAMNRELPTATLTRYNHTNQTIPRANLLIRLI